MKKLFIGFGFMFLAVIYTAMIKIFIFGPNDLEPIIKSLNPIQIPTLLFFAIGIYFVVVFAIEDYKKSKELQKKFKKLELENQDPSKE